MRDAFKYAAQLLLYLSRSFWCDVHLIIVPAPCFRPYLQGAGPFIARKYDYFPVVGSDRINDMTVSDSHPRHVGYCQNLDFACLQAKIGRASWRERVCQYGETSGVAVAIKK